MSDYSGLPPDPDVNSGPAYALSCVGVLLGLGVLSYFFIFGFLLPALIGRFMP
jgi:hypothetical protein